MQFWLLRTCDKRSHRKHSGTNVLRYTKWQQRVSNGQRLHMLPQMCQPCEKNLLFFSIFSVDWCTGLYLTCFCKITLIVVNSSKIPWSFLDIPDFVFIWHVQLPCELVKNIMTWIWRCFLYLLLSLQNSWLQLVITYLMFSVARTCTNATMEMWGNKTNKAHPSKIFFKALWCSSSIQLVHCFQRSHQDSNWRRRRKHYVLGNRRQTG